MIEEKNLHFEILDDSGNVVDLIVADLEFMEEHYPGKYREMIPPELPEIPEELKPKIVQVKDFIMQITEQEFKNAVKAQNDLGEFFRNDLTTKDVIDLKDEHVKNMMDALVTNGIMSEERKTEILNNIS